MAVEAIALVSPTSRANATKFDGFFMIRNLRLCQATLPVQSQRPVAELADGLCIASPAAVKNFRKRPPDGVIDATVDTVMSHQATAEWNSGFCRAIDAARILRPRYFQNVQIALLQKRQLRTRPAL